jgi:exonuclease SbcD
MHAATGTADRKIMTHLMHVADLHLTAGDERDYALSVLNEIVEIANQKSVEALLLCGDVFDSFDDAARLRTTLREAIAKVRSEVLYCPGNHEVLRGSLDELVRLDFGKARLLARLPFDFTTIETVKEAIEVLAVPHQNDYSGYRDWTVPEKKTEVRLAMAHGVVTDLTYVGPDHEAGGAALGPDLFQRFSVDYAAVGHIHRRPKERLFGHSLINYAGSARVWSGGETGPRGAFLVTCNRPPSLEFVPLTAAGEYRLCEVSLDLTGRAAELAAMATWQRADYIHLRLTGLVEDENEVVNVVQDLATRIEPKVRKLKIDRDAVTVLAGISAEPAAKRFIELWEKQRPPVDDTNRLIWLKARALGLEKLKEALEKRRC